MSVIGHIVPASTVLIVTLAAAVPWGVPMEEHPFARYLVSFLPFLAIHFWLDTRPSAMPPVIAFAAGLVMDVVTRGPLGFWASVFLVGQLVVALRGRRWGSGVLAGSAGFAATTSVLALVIWTIASAYHLRPLDPTPIAGMALAAICLYPLVALILGLLARERAAPLNAGLQRGERA